jgi:hypothetical protein
LHANRHPLFKQKKLWDLLVLYTIVHKGYLSAELMVLAGQSIVIVTGGDEFPLHFAALASGTEVLADRGVPLNA